jgi:hypothetical protein
LVSDYLPCQGLWQRSCLRPRAQGPHAPILAAHGTKEMVRMVKVSIRVHSGAARFDVAVLAESAEQAVVLVRARYRTSRVRVRSLADLGVFDHVTLPRAMAA